MALNGRLSYKGEQVHERIARDMLRGFSGRGVHLRVAPFGRTVYVGRDRFAVDRAKKIEEEIAGVLPDVRGVRPIAIRIETRSTCT